MATTGRAIQHRFLGIDVGGTFTDVVVNDDEGVWTAKAFTTHGAIARGVLEACGKAAEQRGLELRSFLRPVARIGLGTTLVTNVLASRTGLRTGLLATAGFEDSVLFERSRAEVDAQGWRLPAARLVTRREIVGIDERIDHRGRVLKPLQPGDAARAATALVNTRDVEAIAVSFLWSWRNPAHEAAAAAEIREAFPDLVVAVGSELAPVIRERDRTTLALLNAYCGSSVDDIDSVIHELQAAGAECPVFLVHSGGGVATPASARRAPVTLAESGPAAGVAGAHFVGTLTGHENLLTCDMGGTSFDVSIVRDGEPARQTRGQLMGFHAPFSRIDVESIGAGGGSVAWIDARGMLRVGPHSAGSTPGPACYGRGGTAATVTDALVLLGFIDPGAFLGGEWKLDAQRAEQACGDLGAELGWGAEDTAWAIRELALEEMRKALRIALATRGANPARYAMVSYGGCAGLFAVELAQSVGVRSVLVPSTAPVLSAFGASSADIRCERVRAVSATLPAGSAAVVEAMADLRTSVEGDLRANGVAAGEGQTRMELELRFRHQVHEIAVPVDGSVDWAGEAIDRFHSEYVARYGAESIVAADVEVALARCIGTAPTPRPARSGDVMNALGLGQPTARLVRTSRGARQEVPSFTDELLWKRGGATGPAVIDRRHTTVWLPEKARAVLHAGGTTVVEVGP